LLNASPAASKGSVGEIWAGWVESEKFIEDDLELGICESGFHEFDAVDVWQARDVVEEGWCGPAADYFMDLEGCSAAEFPGIQYECSGDGTIAFEDFGEERDCLWEAPWVVPCISSGRVSERGYGVGRPGVLPEEFAVRADGKASTEGSAEVRELRKEVFLMLFCVGQDLAEIGWDCFLN
jgi:hypothetical protein